MDLIDNAFDQYVVQGVAHNLGFGKSIVHNEAFAAGDYSTAFIPDFYPEGYSGDVLNNDQKKVIALAAHRLKNTVLSNNLGKANSVDEKVVYVKVMGKGEEKDHDWKVERLLDNKFEVTDLASEKSQEIDMSSFDFEHNCLIKMNSSEGHKTLQLLNINNDVQFDFYYGGGKVETLVYDELQWKYESLMAPPVKIDHTRQIISPMPGAVVSVSVKPGQTVVDGQELCIIEAMKMQNILKSEK